MECRKPRISSYVTTFKHGYKDIHRDQISGPRTHEPVFVHNKHGTSRLSAALPSLLKLFIFPSLIKGSSSFNSYKACASRSDWWSCTTTPLWSPRSWRPTPVPVRDIMPCQMYAVLLSLGWQKAYFPNLDYPDSNTDLTSFKKSSRPYCKDIVVPKSIIWKSYIR